MAFLIRAIIAIAALLLPLTHAYAESALQLAEQEIKAGLLYNFLKYTQWPGEKAQGAPMAVCVFGEDPFGGYLQPIATRTVQQRAIAVRFVQSLPETESCDMLYIGALEKTRWPELRSRLKGKPVLTVSDYTGFNEAGGMLEFGNNGKHVTVSLSTQAVTAAGLTVQDRLLKLVQVTSLAGNGAP